MHWDTFKQDNYSTEGGDGGSRVVEVQMFDNNFNQGSM